MNGAIRFLTDANANAQASPIAEATPSIFKALGIYAKTKPSYGFDHMTSMLSKFHRQREELSHQTNSANDIVHEPVPSRAPMDSSQTNSHTGKIEVEEHVYTSALKEFGDAEGFLPSYDRTQVSLQPIRWRVTVHYRDFQSSAEASSRKAAKHSASKSLWLQMGKGVIANKLRCI